MVLFSHVSSSIASDPFLRLDRSRVERIYWQAFFSAWFALIVSSVEIASLVARPEKQKIACVALAPLLLTFNYMTRWTHKCAHTLCIDFPNKTYEHELHSFVIVV